ncbi:zinc-dependent peptidase [Aquabacterium sp. OR-4]|uniref:M90 family metallopeptidase n=1 Tax=Aquabacterium sp. OR-4 TaxID=2978127 RepID=UPI0021B3B61D|nr:M90 family metallopeptidase [Aquabacterium sp. OR-4]MDT7835298.1 zinc-dependent peptidase [Aquabacterium sp. OR-4]
MKAWLERWRAHREQRALNRRAVPDAVWDLTLARLPFLARRPAADLAELRRLTSLFLDAKEFTGIAGLAISDDMAVCIAAQACLPVLRFGLAPYDSFVGIVVHADEVVAPRSHVDEDGIVHEYHEVLTGEAMQGGPVMLSWRDVAESGESADWGYNVVIHEFAHVLDMGDGEADGVPPLGSSAEREAWITVIDAAYEQFCAQVETGQDTLLDPYGATGVDEFFAVASESFFVTPNDMRAEHPDLYGLLARYFRQDPAAFGGV